MDTQILLDELRTKLAAGEITQIELLQHLGITQVEQPDGELPNSTGFRFSITKVLYALGAAIVTVGIVIFAVQIWDDISTFGRITITLGLGMVLAVLGSVLLQQIEDKRIGLVFHIIGGLLIPLGAVVTMNEFMIDSLCTATFTFFTIFVLYTLLYFVHRNVVLTFFVIANATVTIYLFAFAALEPLLSGSDLEVVLQYLTMLIGFGYLALAYVFRNGANDKLVGALHFFGSTGMLGAAFYQVFDSDFWVLFYFLFVFGGFYLSVLLKSRAVLVMSTFFLIAHITYITSEYFADSVGWPIALVLLGFLFIGLGYTSIKINQRFIK